MKKYKISLIFAAATALMLSVGCDKNSGSDDRETDDSSITLSEESLIAGPEGGAFSVKVTSSEDWRVSGLCDWVELGSESGHSGSELSVKVDPNETADVREATFKVFAGSAVKTLKITSNPALMLELSSADSVFVGADATQITVSLVSNMPELETEISDEAKDWISRGETTEAFGKKLITFNIARSNVFKARDGMIRIGASDVSDASAEVPIIVNIRQAQRDTAFVNGGDGRIIKDLAAYDIPVELKSNVDFSYNLPSWLVEKSKTETPAGEDGLKTINIVLHCDAASGSRGATIQFYTRKGYYDTVVYGSVYIKQQNPNPVWATIPDPQLRNMLSNAGWIIAEDGSEKAELAGPGIEGTELAIGSTSSWGSVSLSSLAGLEAFPKLATLTLNRVRISDIDLSACTHLTSVTLNACQNFSTVKLGDSPVDNLKLVTGNYDYITVSSVTFSGSQVKNIDLSANSYYLSYEDLESIDVSACPALKSLNAKREAKSWYGDPSAAPNFKKIFVSADQKAAYDAGTLTITKFDSVELEVK